VNEKDFIERIFKGIDGFATDEVRKVKPDVTPLEIFFHESELVGQWTRCRRQERKQILAIFVIKLPERIGVKKFSLIFPRGGEMIPSSLDPDIRSDAGDNKFLSGTFYCER
jgi:hypothetical protein